MFLAFICSKQNQISVQEFYSRLKLQDEVQLLEKINFKFHDLILFNLDWLECFQMLDE